MTRDRLSLWLDRVPAWAWLLLLLALLALVVAWFAPVILYHASGGWLG